MSKIRALIADDFSVMQALACGARGNIRKPFTPDQVKERVLPALENKP